MATHQMGVVGDFFFSILPPPHPSFSFLLFSERPFDKRRKARFERKESKRIILVHYVLLRWRKQSAWRLE